CLLHRSRGRPRPAPGRRHRPRQRRRALSPRERQRSPEDRQSNLPVTSIRPVSSSRMMAHHFRLKAPLLLGACLSLGPGGVACSTSPGDDGSPSGGSSGAVGGAPSSGGGLSSGGGAGAAGSGAALGSGGATGGAAPAGGTGGAGATGAGAGGSWAACDEFVLPPDCSIPDGAVLPGELRCTGLYSDWEARTLRCGVTAYAPGYELWSDGAEKQRYVWLPPGATIDVSDPDDWDYPVGT